MKICSKCNENLDLECFNKHSKQKDGLNHWCRLCTKAYKKSYYDVNLLESRKERLEYKKANKAKISIYQRSYLSKRYQKDPIFRIIKNQRNRLRDIVTVKPCSFSKSIGCSSEDLKKYLESKFTEGMSWSNYGQWEIDHILPLSKFNLLNKTDFETVCHYTNLQPLWKKDNIAKSNKV